MPPEDTGYTCGITEGALQSSLIRLIKRDYSFLNEEKINKLLFLL